VAPLAVSLDRAALRSQAAADQLPPLLRDFAPGPARGERGARASLASRLTALPDTEREAYLLDLVRAEVAAVVGHRAADSIDPDRAFKKLGFDSVTAVDLRNRVTAMTGVRLPATTVFDYPTAKKLAGRVLETLGGGADTEPEPALADELDLSAASDDEIFELLDRRLGQA
jgi:pimaricinolide synthase PimS1